MVPVVMVKNAVRVSGYDMKGGGMDRSSTKLNNHTEESGWSTSEAVEAKICFDISANKLVCC